MVSRYPHKSQALALTVAASIRIRPMGHDSRDTPVFARRCKALHDARLDLEEDVRVQCLKRMDEDTSK